MLLVSKLDSWLVKRKAQVYPVKGCNLASLSATQSMKLWVMLLVSKLDSWLVKWKAQVYPVKGCNLANLLATKLVKL